jgi:ribosome-associated heat shock protein Hsp15
VTGERQRLDKWLWFARVVRTRTAAAELVSEGRVRVNRVRIETPAHAVRIGDVVTVGVGPRVLVRRVVGLGARRGPPHEARGLYEDLAPTSSEE